MQESLYDLTPLGCIFYGLLVADTNRLRGETDNIQGGEWAEVGHQDAGRMGRRWGTVLCQTRYRKHVSSIHCLVGQSPLYTISEAEIAHIVYTCLDGSSLFILNDLVHKKNCLTTGKATGVLLSKRTFQQYN